jgi:hypothetical protein
MSDKEVIKAQHKSYVDRGYASREEYLEGLAKDYGVDADVVFNIADVLGPTEDFDGLLCMLDDVSEYIFGGN